MRRFVIGFVATASALFVLYWITEVTGIFGAVNVLNAMLSGIILDLVGIATDRSGSLLAFAGSGMQVISECSGIYAAIVFSASVLAFPTTWRARATGVALGVVAIFAVNVLRLVTVGVTLAYRESLVPWVHEYLWQILFVLVVAGMFMLWIDKLTPRRQTAEKGST